MQPCDTELLRSTEARRALRSARGSRSGTAQDSSEAESSLLQPGETCWRKEQAERVAFLVDGECYFRCVAEAIENARRSIRMLGWDFHTSVRLRRDGASDSSDDLVELLERAVRRNRSLHVHVLAWDFAMLYALEREFLPLLQFGKRTHRRIHFAMDSAHPLAASQHQKLVVIDDAVAFAGGFDLTAYRWDTRTHDPDDPRRITPDGKSYQPFHDVQIAVDGEAARALGDLSRNRWRRATGQRLHRVNLPNDPWPASLEPAVRNVAVGIARTRASIGTRSEIREVEALYSESIAAARRSIYIENQYLTAPSIGDWLAARLGESDGPEIVIVGPRKNSGWLEQNTMGVLRDRIIRRLRQADEYGRLRVLYAHHDRLPADSIINIHSKVMVVDDDFVRVGSSNLSNRSLGLDTECDLAVEARGRDDVRRAIARFRNDLLAEHLGTTLETVSERLAATGSLVETVDQLAGEPRTLRPVEVDANESTAAALDALGAVDPEHPVPLEELVSRFEAEDEGIRAMSRGNSIAGFIALLVAIAAVAGALRFTSVGDWVTSDQLSIVLAQLREVWFGTPAAIVLFAIGCLFLVPVMALTVAAGAAFGAELGIVVALTGTVLASAVGHFLGKRLWRESVRRMAGDRLNALSKRLARRGIISSALVRVVPVAPFMIVNLVAGASHVSARDFLIGTLIGIVPGTILLAVTGDQARSFFSDPSGTTPIAFIAALVALIVLSVVVRVLQLRLQQRTSNPAS